MPARRAPDGLKLLHTGRAPHPVARDAALAGIGVEWTDVPPVLDAAGRAEWLRLGEVFAGDPVRFREGDRAALIAYCAFWSAFLAASGEVAEHGPIVEGRSDKDRGRLVKSPATVAMREASVQLRYWCRELALTPDSRGRSGISDEPKREDEDNPFAG